MSDETESKESERTPKREGDRPANGEPAKEVAEAVAQPPAPDSSDEREPNTGDDAAAKALAARRAEKTGKRNAASDADGDDEQQENDDDDKIDDDEAPEAAASAAKADATKGDAKTAEDESPLLVKGNPLRKWRGGVTMGVGGVLAYLLMAHNGQLAIAVPLGTLLVMVAAWGVMDLLGTFDDPDDRVADSVSLATLRGPLLGFGSMFLAFAGSLAGGASGAASQIMWGVLVTVTFIAMLVALYRLGVALGPWRKDEAGLDRPLLRRHGFWLLVAGAVLYFPTMGIFSLWDPWETHYGEVAREILARDDWISLWWAQDGWFWSKPILNFWIQALAMAALGTHYKADQMMLGVGGATAHPEWVVRAPNVLMMLLAMYLFYKGVSKVFGRRAGLLGGLVLATMPDWFFLAHQTMTDMPFVAAMTSAMGLLLLGLNTDENALARVYEVKTGKHAFRLSGWHAVFGVILVCALPQILYLLSRNVELVLHGSGPFGFRAHWDEFRSGSAGNCGLPGNEGCNPASPAAIPRSVGPHPEGAVNLAIRLFGGFEPVVQALVWALVLGSILYVNWGERRVRRLFYVGAWFFAALATMAKGPAGFGIPAICAFAYIATKKRWSELGKLEMLSGLLVILAVALPWYVAMYVRHGSPFTDRLIFHDMFNRAFSHVHDTNEGDDTSFRFYIWQLGYALFPWTGLVPMGLIWWLRRSDGDRFGGTAGLGTFAGLLLGGPVKLAGGAQAEPDAKPTAAGARGDTSVFLFMWFIFAFALFSFMGTKFHHYIFPAVPPAAMLLGIVLDDMLGEGVPVTKGSLPMYLLGLAGGLGLVVVGVSRFWPGSIFGGKNGAELAPASMFMALLLSGAGLATVVMSIRFFSPKPGDAEAKTEAEAEATKPEPAADGDDAKRRLSHESLMIGAAVVAGALVTILVGRDLAIKPEGADQPGAIRLLQLFTYNYRRPWPESLDFTAVLTGFAIVACVLSAALALRKLRPHLTLAFLAFSFVWALWGLDVYMMKTSPHWGQHEVIQAYYANRSGPDEPLVAYQMNWKGENFYTSNRIPAFVSSGQPFTSWVKKEKEKGTKVMYFVTEHSRTGGLRSEVQGKAFREMTDKALCNKFVLVRAEL